MTDPQSIARVIHEARCGDSPATIEFGDLCATEDAKYLAALYRDAEAVCDWFAAMHKPRGELNAPPYVYIQLADNGQIKKWARVPFDGATAYRLADCRPAFAPAS